MTLKSLLVFVNDAKSSLSRVDLALSVARDHDAHLTGIGILAPPTPAAYSSAELSPELLLSIVDESRERLSAAETVFRDAVKRAGWEARSDWQKEKGFVADLLGLHARYADLTIIDRDDPYKGPVGSPSLQEEMLLRTGRPLMVVPQTVEAQQIGRRLMIAWNGSRESARAVADAIPFIENADQVRVLCANPDDIGDLPGADITAHLARHNTAVEATTLEVSSRSVGEAIAEAAADWSADLIVMGAYGHSRLREYVMGGVTRHMLHESKIPLLMSH